MDELMAWNRLDILEFITFAIMTLDSYDVNNSYWKTFWNYDGSYKYHVIIISHDHWTQLKIITINKSNNWKHNIHKIMIVKTIYNKTELDQQHKYMITMNNVVKDSHSYNKIVIYWVMNILLLITL